MEDSLLGRWLRFNGVGVAGAVVQLLVLHALTGWAHMPNLAAAALSVEAAILHNFFLHERWTWRDRRNRGDRLARLARFHALNGIVSLVGNVVLMHILSGLLGFHPASSAVAAIALCSLINFAAGHRLVFRTAAAIGAVALAVPAHAEATGAPAADLKKATAEAWSVYERQVDARFNAAGAAAAPFFTLDAFGEPGWQDRARAGGVVIRRLDRPSPQTAEPEVPDGKVHHWAGAVFVPGLTVDDLLRRLAALAGQEQQHHADVVGSRLLSRDGDRYRIFLKLRRTKIITATYSTEHEVHYRRLGTGRAAMRSASTRIAQLDGAGTPEERERPPGNDSGYLWRLNAYWRYEAVPGGVLIECESVSLSRAIPFVVRPFATGVVEGIARESLERTLGELRAYLGRRPPA